MQYHLKSVCACPYLPQSLKKKFLRDGYITVYVKIRHSTFQTAYVHEECNIYWLQSEKERTGY